MITAGLNKNDKTYPVIITVDVSPSSPIQSYTCNEKDRRKKRLHTNATLDKNKSQPMGEFSVK